MKKSVVTLAKQIKTSEGLFKKQTTKNYLVWVNTLAEFVKFEDNKIKDLKDELERIGISRKTVTNRFSLLNSALKLKLDATTCKSFTNLENTLKSLKTGAKKVNKGIAIDDPKTAAKLVADAEIVKAKNENELTILLADAKIKNFAKLVDKNGWDLSIVVKAINKLNKK